MDIATAYEITTGQPAPTGSLSHDPETRRVVNLAKRQTEEARALGFYPAAELLLNAQINIDAFMRGMVSLEGAKHYVLQAKQAAERVGAILDQVEAR